MPFKSKSQQRWAFANKPRMALKWAHEMGKGAIKRLPQRKKKTK